MVKYVCDYCKKEFETKRTIKSATKFCCREHWKLHIKEKGTWNKGKTWKEMYNQKSLKKLIEMNKIKGEKHPNYNRKRPDNILRNLLNNPSRTKEQNEKIQKEYEKNPEETYKRLVDKAILKKEIAYQRKAFKKYGRICNKCGRTEGQIDVHHKDMDHKNNDIDNLEVLCASCHCKLHWKYRI